MKTWTGISEILFDQADASDQRTNGPAGLNFDPLNLEKYFHNEYKHFVLDRHASVRDQNQEHA